MKTKVISGLLIAVFLVTMLSTPLASTTASVSAANPPEPTYGTAVVNGDYSEWDLDGDFFANMYRAAKDTKKVESKLYLRYDCSTNTLYALVLAVEGVPVLTTQPDDSYIKINGTKVVEGNDDPIRPLGARSDLAPERGIRPDRR